MALPSSGDSRISSVCAGRAGFSTRNVIVGRMDFFVGIILVCAVIDSRMQLVPDVLTLPLLWLGLFFNLQGGFVSLSQVVVGAMVVMGPVLAFLDGNGQRGARLRRF
ncbi:prepilin peptidase [Raoultella planticola]|nr:prepilin peptidase [Raoultella planticola]MCE9858294.1 prepilin peptidase [Raoultella planticola]